MSENLASKILLVSYVPVSVIKDVLSVHSDMVKCAAYIYHDKEKKEPHWHIYLHLKRSRDVGQVCRWFTYCDLNTFGEKCTYSGSSVLGYFTHTNDSSKNDPEKFEYSKDDIYFYNTSYDVLSGATNICLQIIDDMLCHTNIYTLIARYGKDFVYHYKMYRELISDILDQNAADSSLRSSLRDIFGDIQSNSMTEVSNSDLPFDV